MSYATKEQLQELAAYMASQINVPTIGIGGGYAPVGTIISFMGTTAPQDYLACDGSTKNIADYPQLAAFFESQFGSKSYFGGDGTTTFAVPDLRGEFLRGTGTNSHTGNGNGASVGTHQNATGLPKYQSWGSSSQPTFGIIGSNVGGENSQITDGDSSKSSIGSNLSWVQASGFAKGTTALTTDISTVRPTNTSILWCIKATSVNENMDTTGSVYITKPNTWVSGTVYNFGDGVYGLRKTGTLTAAANTMAVLELAYLPNATATIVNCGGYYNIPDHTGQYPLDSQIYINSVRYVTTGEVFRAQGYLTKTSAGSIVFQYKSALALTDAPYDIWLLYTKA